MAVTRVKLGHSTLREKLGALLFLACILAGSVIGAGVVGPMRYQAQMDALDLSPGSVGSAADHSAPEVSTLAEMQANERFILVNEEFGDWQRSTGAMVGDTYYNKITLTDGTILAARINFDSEQTEYIQDGNTEITLWSDDHVLVTYPIGTLRPWPEGVEQAAAAADWFTYKDGYVDMEGDFGIEPPDKDSIVRDAQLKGSAIGMAAGILLVLVMMFRGDKKERNASTPKNDLERWILGTYANWAQFFHQLNYKGKLTEPDTVHSPLYFGGKRKDNDGKKFTIETLKDSWDIKNLQDLLETVDYMSRGPGLQNCTTQADRAWELCRSTQLLGMAYIAGWLSREDMVERSCTVCRTIQSTFQGWEELTQSYLDGCIQWTLQSGLPMSRADMRRSIHDNLCRRADSPYRLPWDLQLDAGAWARRAAAAADLER